MKFVEKFPKMIKLKELQKFAKTGGSLENMQVLRQSRLSVSKVTKKEWCVSHSDTMIEIARHSRKQIQESPPEFQPWNLLSNLALF